MAFDAVAPLNPLIPLKKSPRTNLVWSVMKCVLEDMIFFILHITAYFCTNGSSEIYRITAYLSDSQLACLFTQTMLLDYVL
jgi:hypothetical protein